jgi:fucose 4-O-acetylase-like acetyltransferase
MSADLTKGKEYYREIDIARGIAILLVVLGHSIKISTEIIAIPTWAFFHKFIYSFHMPLFMFLAGFVAVKILGVNSMNSKGRYIFGRAKRLLLPYFVCSFLYLPFKIILAKYANNPYDIKSLYTIALGESPDGALWFLYTLFLLSCIFVFINTRNNVVETLIVSLVLLITITALRASELSPTGIWFNPINRIVGYAFYFELGIFARLHYGQIKQYLLKPMLLLLSAFLLIAVNVFEFFIINDISVLKIVSSVCGIWFVVAISLIVATNTMETGRKRGVTSQIFDYLGERSMDIFILHEPFKVAIRIVVFSILHWNYSLCVLILFVGSMTCSLLASKLVVRRFAIMRLFFGEIRETKLLR